MHWLDTHQPLVETIAGGVLALVAIIVLLALVKVVRQGRRAMFGAQPVIGPTEFISEADGRLRLVVPFANAAAANAYRLTARLITDRVSTGSPTGPVTIYGYGAEPADNRVRIPFEWPVGILDAEVTVTWTWHDAAGDWDGVWRGHMRVPDPALPDELESALAAAATSAEDAGGPTDDPSGDQPGEPAAVAGEPRVDPLSRIRGGTAKKAKPPEPGQ